MPRKTMDAYLADLVREAVQEVIAPLMKEVQSLKKELAETKLTMEGMGEAGGVDEKLITQLEARKRLGVNGAAFRRIVAMGEIAQITTPNGRTKVVASSLNAYIRRLAGEAG